MGAKTTQTLGFLLSAAVLAGCSRAPQPEICPTLERGALVITELRGAQAGGADTYGQWLELVNTTDAEIDLYGLRISWRRKDGTGDLDILVRENVIVPAGEYAVLGHHDPEASRDFVDYSFFTDHFKVPEEDKDDDGPDDEDFDEPDDLLFEPVVNDILPEGVIDLMGCGDELIDQLVYDPLPPSGSFSLGADAALDPDANDDLTAWCPDLFEPTMENTEIGLPGSPGEANRPCP